jgi:hypothetical protein
MIAGDVRTLARDYCKKGTTIWYEQYEARGGGRTRFRPMAVAVAGLARPHGAHLERIALALAGSRE